MDKDGYSMKSDTERLSPIPAFQGGYKNVQGNHQDNDEAGLQEWQDQLSDETKVEATAEYQASGDGEHRRLSHDDLEHSEHVEHVREDDEEEHEHATPHGQSEFVPDVEDVPANEEEEYEASYGVQYSAAADGGNIAHGSVSEELVERKGAIVNKNYDMSALAEENEDEEELIDYDEDEEDLTRDAQRHKSVSQLSLTPQKRERDDGEESYGEDVEDQGLCRIFGRYISGDSNVYCPALKRPRAE
jgi:hypothetical protein